MSALELSANPKATFDDGHHGCELNQFVKDRRRYIKGARDI